MPLRAKKGPISKAELDAAVKRIDEQLEHARASKAKLEERAKEYDELQGVLESLPEKVRHPVMVPFGPMAFFEGYMEHTNEVLTQLSSEWFALRTTGSALEMVGRRQERLRRDREDVAREERELQMRRRVALGEGASEGRPMSTAPAEAPTGTTVRHDEEGFLDIREPYLEDGDEGSAPAAPDRLSTPPGPLAPAAASGVVPGEAGVLAGHEGDVLSRLRELERMEESEELEELDELGDLTDRGGANAGQPGNGGTTQGPNREQLQSAPAPRVRSPADLFAMMSKAEEECSEARDAPPERDMDNSKASEGDKPRLRSTSATGDAAQPTPAESAFGRGIVERGGSAGVQRGSAAAAPAPSGSLAGAAEGAPAASASTAAPKRISKFKAERQRGRS